MLRKEYVKHGIKEERMLRKELKERNEGREVKEGS
jgi:hypothetical protein